MAHMQNNGAVLFKNFDMSKVTLSYFLEYFARFHSASQVRPDQSPIARMFRHS